MTTPLHRSPHPLSFVAATGTGDAPQSPGAEYRAEVMGLGGFQKEGLVEDLRTGRAWRLVCDEGTYLRGADMAPAPLAYWIAGLHGDITAHIAQTARDGGTDPGGLSVTVSQGFGVTGSFAKGEATALVYGLECSVSLASGEDDTAVSALVQRALGRSPVLAAMTGAHEGLFALTANGKETPVSGFRRSTAAHEDPFLRHAGRPAPAEARPGAAPASIPHPHDDGRPIMLTDDDDGTVSWRVQARGGPDPGTGLIVSHAGFSGAASTWTLFSDPASRAAPAPLAHFSIGTAFCFHTQLCRYVNVRKLPAESPRLSQLSRFPGPEFEPLDTRMFVRGRVSGEAATSLMSAAARTCYAHRAIAVPVEHRVSVSHQRRHG